MFNIPDIAESLSKVNKETSRFATKKSAEVLESEDESAESSDEDKLAKNSDEDKVAESSDEISSEREGDKPKHSRPHEKQKRLQQNTSGGKWLNDPWKRTIKIVLAVASRHLLEISFFVL